MYGCSAEDPLARRHHAPAHDAAGVHAAAGSAGVHAAAGSAGVHAAASSAGVHAAASSAGATPAAAPDAVPRRAGTQRKAALQDCRNDLHVAIAVRAVLYWQDVLGVTTRHIEPDLSEAAAAEYLLMAESRFWRQADSWRFHPHGVFPGLGNNFGAEVDRSQQFVHYLPSSERKPAWALYFSTAEPILPGR